MFFLRFVPYQKAVLHCATTPSSRVDPIIFGGNLSGSTNHVFGLVKLHDFLFKLPGHERGRRGVQSPYRPESAPWENTDCPACEPRSITCEKFFPERNIQYNRTANLCAMAILATP